MMEHGAMSVLTSISLILWIYFSWLAPPLVTISRPSGGAWNRTTCSQYVTIIDEIPHPSCHYQRFRSSSLGDNGHSKVVVTRNTMANIKTYKPFHLLGCNPATYRTISKFSWCQILFILVSNQLDFTEGENAKVNLTQSHSSLHVSCFEPPGPGLFLF
jgi:hypothetical protein